MDYQKALQLVALKEVLSDNPSENYVLRKVFRWFSKEFSTPLLQVEELPLEDVLLAYYENLYEQMDENDREEERKRLLETEEETRAREAAEDQRKADDDNYLREVEAEEKEAQSKSKLKQLETKTLKAAEAIGNLTDAVKQIGDIAALQPDISFKFTDESFDPDGDSLGLGLKDKG